MYHYPIGVFMDCFRVNRPEAIQKAVAVGAKAIQLTTTRGEYAPENLTAQGRKELLTQVQDAGLVFSALCCDNGKRYWDPAVIEEQVEFTKRVLDLALDLGTKIVTTHIGVIPADPNHPRFKIMQDACGRIAEYGHSVGACLAVETGPEPSAVLRVFLDSIHSDGIAVNLDPANLKMIVNEDSVQAVHNLAPYIVHTHAKDGIQLVSTNPEYIYHILPRPKELENVSLYREVPLGCGNVPFPAYLKALEEVGYRGFLTIERETGDHPEEDIRLAVDFLQKTMAVN